MPELPEVETTVRALRPLLVGRTLLSVENDWPNQIGRPSLPQLQARIQQRKIEAIDRRGKYILIHLSGRETLIIHLRMSGHLAVVDAVQPIHKHVHTLFNLDGQQQLRFRDQRKFGKVYLVQDPHEVLAPLGPEPLEADFTVAVLKQRLQHRKRVMKSLLLDQTFVAGIGNIYADEALFYAGVRPTRTANSLSEADIQALHSSIRKVLQMGIAREGASIDLYTKPDGSRGDMQNAVAVFRRTGDPCYTCGAPIERIVLGGRSTHFCPHCQS